MIFLYIVLGMIAFAIYVALGFVISATLCKRSGASWRWWSSNLGEFIMSMSLPGLGILAIFWPIQVLIGLVLTAPSALINAFKRITTPRLKVVPVDPKDYWKDHEFSNMYPTTIRALNLDEAYAKSVDQPKKD
jgi:hypothetical protein